MTPSRYSGTLVYGHLTSMVTHLAITVRLAQSQQNSHMLYHAGIAIASSLAYICMHASQWVISMLKLVSVFLCAVMLVCRLEYSAHQLSVCRSGEGWTWERITHEIIHNIGLLICEHLPCIEIFLTFVSGLLSFNFRIDDDGEEFLKEPKGTCWQHDKAGLSINPSFDLFMQALS